MTESATQPTTTGSAGVQASLWSARAADYTALQEPLFLPLYEAVLLRLELAGGGALLDVGCGPGLAAATLSKAFSRVDGIDASPSFIETARTRCPHGTFVAGEMESLPYADQAFDAVTGFNAFQYAASPVRALREARRVVKPTGQVVIAVWGPPEMCDAAGHLKALGPLMPPSPAGAPGPFALSQETALKALAADAGLVPVDIVDVDCPWVYADLDMALRGMLSAGPVERAIRASGIEKVRAAVAEAIAPYCMADGAYRLRNIFRVLIARP
jgi:SAM-dependent methyltransferase